MDLVYNVGRLGFDRGDVSSINFIFGKHTRCPDRGETGVPLSIDIKPRQESYTPGAANGGGKTAIDSRVGGNGSPSETAAESQRLRPHGKGSAYYLSGTELPLHGLSRRNSNWHPTPPLSTTIIN
jgi:hypothetical protein